MQDTDFRTLMESLDFISEDEADEDLTAEEIKEKEKELKAKGAVGKKEGTRVIMKVGKGNTNNAYFTAGTNNNTVFPEQFTRWGDELVVAS